MEEHLFKLLFLLLSGDNTSGDECTFNGDWFNERGSKVSLANTQDRRISGA